MSKEKKEKPKGKKPEKKPPEVETAGKAVEERRPPTAKPERRRRPAAKKVRRRRPAKPEAKPKEPEAEVEKPEEERPSLEEKPAEEAPEEVAEKVEKPKAEEEEIVEERLYTIPLRITRYVPRWKRTPRAVRFVREYVTRHMKPENLLIMPEVNEVLWSHGLKKPPHRIKIRAVKNAEGDVKLYLAGA